jgi:cyclophilin family peptidyl-prolyl cis-trans isomerase
MRTRKFLLLSLFMSIFSIALFAQAKKQAVKKNPASRTATKRTVALKDDLVRIKITTDSGIIIIKLYDSTPLHRDNFANLVKQGFYDSLLFHRVIREFMIQGGDPLSKNAQPGSMLGMGGGDMTRIPAEFSKSLIHKRGALAAARDGNPEKASSACQFYLVQGKKISDAELNMIESSKGIKYSPAQRNTYKTVGGTPFLDMEYTVFGEVESGVEVIDKIAGVPANPANRPDADIRMKMEILK